MTSSVRVLVHEHVVLLRPSHFDNFLDVSTFKVAINKKACGLHHALFLKLEILHISSERLCVNSSVQVESLCRQKSLDVDRIIFDVLYLRAHRQAYHRLKKISHLENILGLVTLVNDIMLLVQLLYALIRIRHV